MNKYITGKSERKYKKLETNVLKNILKNNILRNTNYWETTKKEFFQLVKKIKNQLKCLVKYNFIQ